MTRMVRLGTYITSDSFKELRELSAIYGSQSRALEKAIKLLYNLYNSRLITDVDDLILREEIFNLFDCILITKRNFVNILRGDLSKFYDEQYIYSIIKTITKHNPEDLSLEELVMYLKKIYVTATNWFTEIKIYEADGYYELIFLHNQNKAYSEFLSEYFAKLLQKLGYRTSINIDDKFFSLRVTKEES